MAFKNRSDSEQLRENMSGYDQQIRRQIAQEREASREWSEAMRDQLGPDPELYSWHTEVIVDATLSAIAALRHLASAAEVELAEYGDTPPEGLCELEEMIGRACDAIDEATQHQGIDIEAFDFSEPGKVRSF